MVSVVEDFNTISLHAPFEKPEVMELYKGVDEIKELDNRGELIHRPLFSHSDVPHWLGLDSIHADKFNWSDRCIYSVLLHHRNELAAEYLDIIPSRVLNAVRDLKCKLVLDNVLEGDNAIPFFRELYKSINRLNLPPSQIYYITNNLLAENTHKQWCFSNKVNSQINVISFMYNVFDVKRLIDTPLYRNPIIETETEKLISPYNLTALPDKVCIESEIEYKKLNAHKLKHFLKVNRTNREERNLFMLFLNQSKLLDKCKISFPHFPSNYTYEPKFKPLLYRNNVEDLLKKVPIDIDETDRTNHGPAGFELNNFNADLPFNPIHYKDTFISVVMCAFPLVENACHLHSSTYNPIYCGHPVIQFGPYKHLQELKNRGFKTFSKWWDESYDDIEDPWDRLQAVIDLALDISKKPIEEMLNMYIDMKDTLQHNSDIIKNFNGIEDLKTLIL